MMLRDERQITGRLYGVGGVDALDWFGSLKLFGGLINAAFYGKNSEYALGNTLEHRHMN